MKILAKTTDSGVAEKESGNHVDKSVSSTTLNSWQLIILLFTTLHMVVTEMQISQINQESNKV